MLTLIRRSHPQKLRADVGVLGRLAGRNVPPRRNVAYTSTPASDGQRTGSKSYVTVPTTLLVLGGLGYAAYENYKPFRHTMLAVVRCSRVAGAYVCMLIIQ